MGKTDKKNLAELSDIFTESADVFLNQHAKYDKAIKASLSKEEIAEQKRLLEARCFDMGVDPKDIDQDKLCDDILALNNNLTEFLLREIPVKELSAIIADEHKTDEISHSFEQNDCAFLAQVFKP